MDAGVKPPHPLLAGTLMSQKLTSVEFYFVAPDGKPVTNTTVVIQLADGGFDKDVPGVIMPREIIRVTDDMGKTLVALQPSETVYYVTVEDKVSEAALSYQFYVPVTEHPDDVVRLQDIIVDGEMSKTPYDKAALLVIQEVKSNVLMNRAAAEIAAKDSNTAKESAQAARDMALRTLPITSATAPINPLPNQEWINSITMHRYTWLLNEGVGIWVETGPVLAVDTNPNSGPPFDPSTFEVLNELPQTEGSFVLELNGEACRIPVSDAGMSATDLPVATVLASNDFIVITQNGIDKRVSLAVLADALTKI